MAVPLLYEGIFILVRYMMESWNKLYSFLTASCAVEDSSLGLEISDHYIIFILLLNEIRIQAYY